MARQNGPSATLTDQQRVNVLHGLKDCHFHAISAESFYGHKSMAKSKALHTLMPEYTGLVDCNREYILNILEYEACKHFTFTFEEKLPKPEIKIERFIKVDPPFEANSYDVQKPTRFPNAVCFYCNNKEKEDQKEGWKEDQKLLFRLVCAYGDYTTACEVETRMPELGRMSSAMVGLRDAQIHGSDASTSLGGLDKRMYVLQKTIKSSLENIRRLELEKGPSSKQHLKEAVVKLHEERMAFRACNLICHVVWYKETLHNDPKRQPAHAQESAHETRARETGEIVRQTPQIITPQQANSLTPNFQPHLLQANVAPTIYGQNSIHNPQLPSSGSQHRLYHTQYQPFNPQVHAYNPQVHAYNSQNYASNPPITRFNSEKPILNRQNSPFDPQIPTSNPHAFFNPPQPMGVAHRQAEYPIRYVAFLSQTEHFQPQAPVFNPQPALLDSHLAFFESPAAFNTPTVPSYPQHTVLCAPSVQLPTRMQEIPTTNVNDHGNHICAHNLGHAPNTSARAMTTAYEPSSRVNETHSVVPSINSHDAIPTDSDMQMNSETETQYLYSKPFFDASSDDIFYQP